MTDEIMAELQTTGADKIPWYRQKTTWTAIATVIGVAGAYVMGEVGVVAAIGSILAALTAAFMRQGIEKLKG